MDLNGLKKEIPAKWRVQSFSKFKPQATCVAYIDSRDVMDLLDEVVRAENWQSDYKLINNNLFAGIGIFVDGIWVWKWDTGTETKVEKEKGEASDSFKRAAVKWGVGRFLYSLDIERLPADMKKADNNHPSVVDKSGKKVWDLTEHINKNKGNFGKAAEPTKQNKRTDEDNPAYKKYIPQIDAATNMDQIDAIREELKKLKIPGDTEHNVKNKIIAAYKLKREKLEPNIT